MRIVIAGSGEVGSHLAKMLSDEHHDVTVIDDDEKRLDNISKIADIFTIHGDQTTFEALGKIDLKRTKLFIAVSPDESKNIISAMLAKRLGAKKCIARIDNDEYLQPDNKEVFINMGIDYLFYPEKVAADELTTLLGNTLSSEYVSFGGDRLSLVVFSLDMSSPLVGRRLGDMTREMAEFKYRTVAISRGGDTILPTPNDEYMQGDTIYVISDYRYVKEVMNYSGMDSVDVKKMMILGGSKIGQRLARRLQNEMNVKLIEYDGHKAQKLAQALDKTLIINHDGRDMDMLVEEELGSMDAFVAVTGRSETNILAAMLAKRMGVKKVIAEIENMNYIKVAENIGINTIINKKLITASNIFRFTMDTDVQTIKCLTGCSAEVMEFIAKPDSKATRSTIKEMGFSRNAIIGGIVRGDKVYIATGDTAIRAYDRVVVFALEDAISKVGDFFD